jgi:hypothetical protein
MSRREREKEVALEKQGEDMTTGILGLLFMTTRGRRAAAAAHRSNDPIVGDCNGRVVLPNGPEMALLAFLGVDPAVRG